MRHQNPQHHFSAFTKKDSGLSRKALDRIPVAQRKASGTLALVCYFIMVAVMLVGQRRSIMPGESCRECLI